MPRPAAKRSRVAASRPAAVPQKDSSASPAPPAVAATRADLPSVPSSDIYDVSDREKERIRKRLSGAAGARAELSLGDNAQQNQALEDSRRRRDDAMDRLADITSTSDEVQTRKATQDAATRPARLTDASGLDLDESIFGNLDDSLDDTEHAIEDTQDGHRSTDTSSFNIALFKRRPRQSSIVGKDDAPIRPSSRGPNTPSIASGLNLGLFRRRAREPSILGTAQKERASRPESRAASRIENTRNGEDVDGDDSGPDGESTPLNLAKRRSDAAQASPANTSPEASPFSASRKRKSLESHDGGREKRPALVPQPELEPEPEAEQLQPSIEVDSSSLGSLSPSPSLSPQLPPLPVTQDRPSTPDPNDPDNAPPASSDSSESGSPVTWPTLDSLAHRTYNTRRPARGAAAKTPEPIADDGSSELSSPPSLTHSPNYNINVLAAKAKPKTKPAAAARPPSPKVATTADLTSLLPRRRHKVKPTRTAHDPFDIEDSAEEEESNALDGDELSHTESRAAAAATRRRRAAAAGQPLSKSTNRGSGGGSKGKGPAHATAAAAEKQKAVRTYGSRSSDKENEAGAAADDDEIVVGSGGQEDDGDGEEEEVELDPETNVMMTRRMGEELKKAARKFKEVDRWELSFEEVVESSSPLPEGR
ncbi:hypothetical protein B0T22DRAFT_22711 [Podospora appendiculata]|uniref:Uncharacterized protein n=1 Tax=Podospora appendiculata TaxID=314037 RepID=A0AAE1CFK7_9PEZI|nr:hypothetical protein B0T22DRAFT_22711 [Podospora appendiculata]